MFRFTRKNKQKKISMAWIRLGSVCGRNVKKTGDRLENRGKRQASRHKALSFKAFF